MLDCLTCPSLPKVRLTLALPFDVTRAQLQLALEALPAIVPGDIVITEVGPGQFDIEFTGELSSTDVATMAVDTANLTGGTATVQALQAGRDTGLNDVQVLTVHATAGFFRVPAPCSTISTAKPCTAIS